MLSITAVAGRELWDADIAYGNLQSLKAMFKRTRKAKIEIDGKPKMVITNFPTSYIEYQELRPGDNVEVVAPPISVSLIEQRRMTMATRNTHKTVRPPAPSVGAASNPLAVMMQQLMAFQSSLQHPENRLSKSNKAAAPLALTYTGAGAVHSPASTSSISASSDDTLLLDESNPRADPAIAASPIDATVKAEPPAGTSPGTPRAGVAQSPIGAPPLPPRPQGACPSWRVSWRRHLRRNRK